MPKLNRGRVVDLRSMQGLTADELEVRAAKMEAQAADPASADEPAWLLRWAKKLRALAAKKAKGRARRIRSSGEREPLANNRTDQPDSSDGNPNCGNPN